MLRLKHCIALGLCLMLACSSCVRKSEYKHLRAEYDSLMTLNVAYQDQAYETDSLVASVIANFQELNNVESMINVNALRGELPMGEQERIRHNIRLLSDRLEESNNSIELLIKRIEGNGVASMRMQGTVALLREQLSRQQARVETIANETMRKVKAVGELDASLAKLKEETERMKAFNLGEQDRLKAKEDSLNTVYYALGTKGDFREMGLLTREDRITVDNAELAYLTKSDRRDLKEVVMQSKTARLLSVHPAKSYKMRPDKKGYLTLEILDSKSFWEYSQVMLAEVDF